MYDNLPGFVPPASCLSLSKFGGRKDWGSAVICDRETTDRDTGGLHVTYSLVQCSTERGEMSGTRRGTSRKKGMGISPR